jgi:hypothetical protein
MESPSQDATSQAQATPQQPAVNTINCHDEPRNKEISGSRSDWKKVILSKVKDFLITRYVEE